MQIYNPKTSSLHANVLLCIRSPHILNTIGHILEIFGGYLGGYLGDILGISDADANDVHSLANLLSNIYKPAPQDFFWM